MSWLYAIKTIADLDGPDSPGAQPFVSGSFPTFVVLLGSATAYNVVTNAAGGSDVVIDYAGVSTGRTVNLPAATGTGRMLRFIATPLATPSNAMTIQPAGTDTIGNGLASGTVVLQSGDSWIDLQDVATGKWVIASRSANQVTTAKTGTAYVIKETDDVIPVDSTSTVTVALPAGPVIGEKHQVVDITDASMQTITISRNGNNINGAAADKTITTKFGTKTFTWLGGTMGWLESLAIP